MVKVEKVGQGEGELRIDTHYTEQQPQEEEVAAAWAFSSASAWAAHTGVVAGVRYTLSRFFVSFSASIASFRLIMVVKRESNKCCTPISIGLASACRRSKTLPDEDRIRTRIVFCGDFKQLHSSLQSPFLFVGVIVEIFVLFVVVVHVLFVAGHGYLILGLVAAK